MKKLEVIAEFVDKSTGTRIFPAAHGADPVLFEAADDDQAARLTTAGCLREPKARPATTKPVDYVKDKLDKMDLAKATSEQLLAIAAHEKVVAPQGDKVTDDELRAAIEAKRKPA